LREVATVIAKPAAVDTPERSSRKEWLESLRLLCNKPRDPAEYKTTFFIQLSVIWLAKFAI
jgi:hypothetical protein